MNMKFLSWLISSTAAERHSPKTPFSILEEDKIIEIEFRNALPWLEASADHYRLMQNKSQIAVWLAAAAGYTFQF